MSVDVEALAARVGETFGPGDWVTVDQAMIDAYAEISGDHQWIHVDVDRCAAESPFGGTVAHGLLVLSLVPLLVGEAPWLEAKAGINYGSDKVRFIAPVRAGSRVRAACALTAVEPYGDGARITSRVTVEIEGSDKPACIADMIGIVLA